MQPLHRTRRGSAPRLTDHGAIYFPPVNRQRPEVTATTIIRNPGAGPFCKVGDELTGHAGRPGTIVYIFEQGADSIVYIQWIGGDTTEHSPEELTP